MNIHFHKYQAIAVNNYEKGRGDFTIGYVTRLLLKCSVCGNCKSKDIEGTWTLEQLTTDQGYDIPNSIRNRMGRG